MTAMTLDRAKAINALIVEAWLICELGSEYVVPDMSGFSVAEAIRANLMVSTSCSELCYIPIAEVPKIYAWAVATSSLDRIVWEHANA